MNLFDPHDDPRRLWLVQALAMGWYALGLPSAQAQTKSVLGQVPKKLPDNQSVYRLSGQVSVNNQPANAQTRITSGDTIRTAYDSEVVFVVGSSAVMLRANAEVVVQAPPARGTGAAGQQAGVQVVRGGVLAVFAPGQRRIETPSAAVTIRGTGVYVEAQPDETYFCTCYGTAEVSAKDDPASKTTVVATHHDRPLYIVAGRAKAGNAIRNAPFKNHTDEELTLIEALVGRVPPFVHPTKAYERPRPSDDYNR